MNPTQHSSNNRVLGAPPDWDQSEMPCSALAVTDVSFDGQPGIASFWRPDRQELEDLANGGSVMLVVYGRGMPPVSVGVARNQ